MQTRRLGKDGPPVPVICFGGLPIGGHMGPVPEEQAIATVLAAIDTGMTFIDTAESYHASESRIGKAIAGKRHDLFLATKLSGKHSPEHINHAVENSLKALGTDYIDPYQIHRPDHQWPIAGTLGHLARLRDSGEIRYIGVSNFSAEQTKEALNYGPIHSSQPSYNMLYCDAEESILPFCLENGIGVIPYSVLAKGLLTGRYRPGHEFSSDDERNKHDAFKGETFQRVSQFAKKLSDWAADHGRDLVQLAIAWTLAQPAVTSAIVGAKSPQQVYQNAKAADWVLSEGDLREIDIIRAGFTLPGLQPWRPAPSSG